MLGRSLLMADVVDALRDRASWGVVALVFIVCWFIRQWLKWRRTEKDYRWNMTVLREKTEFGHDGDDASDDRATDETATDPANGDAQ